MKRAVRVAIEFVLVIGGVAAIGVIGGALYALANLKGWI